MSIFERPRSRLAGAVSSAISAAVLSLIATGLGIPSTAHAASPDITGEWEVKDGVARVRIAECNGSLWGAVAWERTPGATDKHNPDPSKISRPTLGMVLLLDMKRQGATPEWSGHIYNAQNGKTYDATVKPGSAPDQLELEGCVLGFLCGGQTWTRFGPPPSAAVAGKPGAPKPQKSSSISARSTVTDIGDVCQLPEIHGTE